MVHVRDLSGDVVEGHETPREISDQASEVQRFALGIVARCQIEIIINHTINQAKDQFLPALTVEATRAALS